MNKRDTAHQALREGETAALLVYRKEITPALETYNKTVASLPHTVHARGAAEEAFQKIHVPILRAYYEAGNIARAAYMKAMGASWYSSTQ